MPAAVQPIRPLAAPPDVALSVPGSKSHTNRALICAASAPGRSLLTGVLFADDTEAMIGAISALGTRVAIDREAATVAVVGGPRDLLDATGTEPITVDVRQSGTTGRFLLPLLATTPGRFLLDGHPQLRSRPFGPQLDALRALGAVIDGDGLPLTITGRSLAGGPIQVASSVSSQFLSGLLLAAPLFDEGATISVDGELVSRPYVELTTATMAAFGVEVSVETGPDRQTFDVPGRRYRPSTVALEPDASAASYFFAAAAIMGGRVRIDGLGSDTVQGDLRFVDLLERMGARVRSGPHWTEVEGVGPLSGIEADMADISDTAQTLAVVATFATTPTVIRGIGFVRFKETDRLAAVVTELRRLGIDADETADGMVIRPGTPTGGLVRTYDDHRMAMSFALLGLRHPGIEIENPGCVSKTYPDYFSALDRLR